MNLSTLSSTITYRSMIAIITSIAIFLTFIITMLAIYGIQPSVSAFYYCLPINRQFIFTAFCFFFPSPLLYLNDSIFIDIAVGCIAMIGAAAAYRGDELISAIHKVCAVLALIACQLSLVFDYCMPELSILIISISAISYFLKIKNILLIIEFINYIALITTIILNL